MRPGPELVLGSLCAHPQRWYGGLLLTLHPDPPSRAPSGAGLMGVPVRGERCAAAGAGLQADPAAAELPGPVGPLARQRGHPGPEAARGQPQLPQGRPAVPAKMVFL